MSASLARTMDRPTTEPPRPPPILSRVSDFWAYIIPMAIFLGITQIGVWLKVGLPILFLTKYVLVAIALYLLWNNYTKIRWNHWWLGVLVGIVGIFQWVGMQLFLQSHFEFFKPSPDAFNPLEYFK